MNLVKSHTMKSFPRGGYGDGPINLTEYDNGLLLGCLLLNKQISLNDLSKELLSLEQEIHDLGFSEVFIELDYHEPLFTISGKK
ncbi:hypothetical protein KAR91_50380 [Candidatus Pacearchaeota archaeon]|nr:hypothetical protein [Candidatus Pacearchaeota archaeon]